MAAIALERGCILVALAAGSTHQNRPLPPDDVMFVRERGQASGATRSGQAWFDSFLNLPATVLQDNLMREITKQQYEFRGRTPSQPCPFLERKA